MGGRTFRRARGVHPCSSCGQELVYSEYLKIWVHDQPGAWVGCPGPAGKAKPEEAA